MSGPSSHLHPVDDSVTGQRAALEQVALAATAAEFTSTDSGHSADMLVLALHPNEDRRRVIASPGNSAIRAAISVAVAAGNTRAWAGARGDTVLDLPVATLPEIIRASVEPSGIQSVHVGVVQLGDDVACYSMWLSAGATPAPGVRERHQQVLVQLRTAAEHDRRVTDERARLAAAAAAARAAEAGDRTMARTEATDADSLAALADRKQFELTLEELEADEAAVLVLGIDDAAAIEAKHGSEGREMARRAVASRLTASVRKHDIIAYVDNDTFALVLVNLDRHTAFDVSRRVRSHIAEAMPAELGGLMLSISVGLAHESGLIDPVEMFDQAQAAMRDARQEGGARMLIAC